MDSVFDSNLVNGETSVREKYGDGKLMVCLVDSEAKSPKIYQENFTNPDQL